MTPDQVKDYVEDARQFFNNYVQFLGDRIDELQTRARGESRYVTLWITKIGIINAERALNKIIDFEKEFAGHNNLTEASLQEIVIKVTAHMLRAKEMLQRQEANSSKGSKFIPVNPHHQQMERVLKVNTECSRVLEKHKEIMPMISLVPQNKSWMSKVIRWGIDFVGIRISAHGLDGNLRQDALRSLKDISQELEDMQKIMLPPTNKTKKTLECTIDDPTPQNELHFQYFPRDIEQPINKFLSLMKQNNDQNRDELLTKERVLEEVQTNFPRPQ